jgi:predicted  nucleic acid-binding Zn-ribbon protein
MIKKLVMLVLAVGIVGSLVVGSRLGSYVSTSCERVAEAVEGSVPMEFQIDRARNMVRDLEPEIRRSMHVIAKEEVAVEQLDARIDTAEGAAAKDRSELMRLQSDLQTGERTFRYAGHTYTAHEVKDDLTRRFTRFKTADATLESLRQMRDARQRNLDAAREKLTAMIAAQRQLQVEVENLEAKLKLVEVAQASSDFQFDTSQLAQAKQLMTDIRARLDVAARLADADTSFQSEIPLDEAHPDEITEQVAAYFHLGGESNHAVAAIKVTKEQ